MFNKDFPYTGYQVDMNHSAVYCLLCNFVVKKKFRILVLKVVTAKNLPVTFV